jgi:putative ABC transport system permease protein
MWMLLGTVAAVLMIVCVNIGNLMLVRTMSRNREVGIRMALGSSRAQLFGLVVSEAVIFVLIGSILGLLVANAALKVFVAWAPLDLPRIGDIHMGSSVWIFAIAAAAVSTLVCGFFPAWRLARTDPHESLKTGSANTTAPRHTLRFREVMVSVEVALCTVLLIIGGLLMLSFFRVMRAPKGFEVAHVITQDISMIGPRYPEANRNRMIGEALRQLAEIPGVQSVGVTNQIPLRGETWICQLQDAGPPAKRENGLANFRFVNSGYWESLGIPLKKGRLLALSDRSPGVALLSERAAELLWPGQDPIGKRVGNCNGESSEVIGVVGDVRAGLEQNAPLTVYQPYWNISMSRASFVLRAQADPAAVINASRAVFRSIDADLPISQAITMEQILNSAVAVRRFQMNLVVGFAILALVLASLGIYGVISVMVVQRMPELGIRIALGARAPQLAAMVLRQGMTPVLSGLAAGLVCALSIGRYVASQLYGVAPDDPLTISCVTILLLIVAACACWVPAHRVMRLDPLLALRFE